MALPAEVNQITGMLQSLSEELVASRLDPKSDSTAFDPSAYLSSSAPMFAALHAINRSHLAFTKSCKARTQDARLEMDSAHLKLQNLMFERNHQEQEIRKCEEYESEYQNILLHSVEELQALATGDSPALGLKVPLPEDSHELMLTRLSFELAERQRLDEEKKDLSTQKSKLVKENEAKKARLEALETQLDAFISSAKSIQAKMHESELAANASATSSTTIAKTKTSSKEEDGVSETATLAPESTAAMEI